MENLTFYAPTYFAFGKDTENDTGKYVKRFGGPIDVPTEIPKDKFEMKFDE